MGGEILMSLAFGNGVSSGFFDDEIGAAATGVFFLPAVGSGFAEIAFLTGATCAGTFLIIGAGVLFFATGVGAVVFFVIATGTVFLPLVGCFAGAAGFTANVFFAAGGVIFLIGLTGAVIFLGADFTSLTAVFLATGLGAGFADFATGFTGAGFAAGFFAAGFTGFLLLGIHFSFF
ncbi:MAG: hypothetical protein ABIQ56_06380 [Chitinophagaceae bacterium]